MRKFLLQLRDFVVPALIFLTEKKSSWFSSFLLIRKKIKISIAHTRNGNLMSFDSIHVSGPWCWCGRPQKFSVTKPLFYLFRKISVLRFWVWVFGLKKSVTFNFMDLDNWSCHQKTFSLENWLLLCDIHFAEFCTTSDKIWTSWKWATRRRRLAEKTHRMKVLFYWCQFEFFEKNNGLQSQEFSSIFFGAKLPLMGAWAAYSLPGKITSWIQMVIAFLDFLKKCLSRKKISKFIVKRISINQEGFMKTKKSWTEKFRFHRNVGAIWKISVFAFKSVRRRKDILNVSRSSVVEKFHCG